LSAVSVRVPAPSLVTVPAPLPITPLTVMLPAPPKVNPMDPLEIVPPIVKVPLSELILTALVDNVIFPL
jgi:hypothetical protein